MLLFFVVMWFLNEETLIETTKDKARLQAEYDTLEIDYNIEREAHKKTGQVFASVLDTKRLLEVRVKQLEAQVADLEQKLSSQQVVQKASQPAVRDAAFWRRLADCENPRGDAPGGYFQFMGSTRDKVGWKPGLSYEQQRAMAISWASQIHPNEGTTAGWPVCWWRALKGNND